MTYNEFMGNFDNYIQVRLDYELRKYGSQSALSQATGVNISDMSRLFNGKHKRNFKIISKVLGEDIFDVDINSDSAKEFEIKILEQRLKELKGENGL